MKVYVLNVKENTERLAQFTENYPSCLPEFQVWEALTGEDVVKPDWWQSSSNRWSLVENYINILSEDTDEDILIFEDDCTFAEDFEEKYTAFLEEVPDNWDMLYLGAQHIAIPEQVSDNVLKLVNSVCGHAVIYKNSIRQELINWYRQPYWGCKHMPDMRRAQAMVKGKFKCYSPLVNICGQAQGYSELSKRDRNARWYNTFRYKAVGGFISALEYGEQVRKLPTIAPIKDLEDKEICSVCVYGQSIFYALTFLLKQQELKQQFNFPIVCHVDAYNNDLIHKIARQELIDINDIYFIEHTSAPIAEAVLWRYTPVGASITHTFDVDNKLHPAHIEAIQDFEENGEDFDCYVCKYVRNSRDVLSGAMGVRESLLIPMFDFFGRHIEYEWGSDELFIADYLKNNQIPSLVYTTKGCKHNTTENSVVKPLDFPTSRVHYTKTDFEKFNYYTNGMYHIEDMAYTVTKFRAMVKDDSSENSN